MTPGAVRLRRVGGADDALPRVDRRSADPGDAEPGHPVAPAVLVTSPTTPSSVRGTVNRLGRDTALVVTLAVVLAVAILGVQQHRLSTLTGDLEPQLVANQQLLQAVTEVDVAFRAYRGTRDPGFLTTYEAAQPTLHDALSTLQGGADDDTRSLVEAQQDAVSAWLVTVSDPGAAGSAAGTGASPSTAALDRVRQTNTDLSAGLQAVRDRLERQASATTAIGVVVLVAVGLVGLALLRRRSRYTLLQVVPPLENLRDVVDELGRGRAGTRADASRGVDEIRTVAAALNGLADVNQQQRSDLDAQISLNDEVRTIGGLTQGSFDIGSIVTETARTVAVGMRADAVWIRAFDGADGGSSRGSAAIYPPTLSEAATPIRLIDAVRAVADAAWRRKAAVLLTPDGPSDELIDPRDRAAIVEILRRDDRDTLLVIALGVGPECLGYLALSRDRHRPTWTEPEREAAQRIGRDLGRSILTARLFAREREVVEQLRALDDQKDQFVATASHELRTPITAILGHIQLVSEGTLGPVPAELATSIEAVDRNSHRLRVLIDDLLSLSRLGQPTPLGPTPVDLVQLIDEVVSVQRFTAEQRRIQITMDTDGELLDVRGHRDELELALSNILDNAVRFSASGAAVAVDVRATDDGAAVVVSDTGPGISAADQERLFTRFFRSTNPEALAIAGTGLGLTITRSIVEKHHGTIAVESALGAGTVVRILLPIVGPGSG